MTVAANASLILSYCQDPFSFTNRWFAWLNWVQFGKRSLFTLSAVTDILVKGVKSLLASISINYERWKVYKALICYIWRLVRIDSFRAGKRERWCGPLLVDMMSEGKGRQMAWPEVAWRGRLADRGWSLGDHQAALDLCLGGNMRETGGRISDPGASCGRHSH